MGRVFVIYIVVDCFERDYVIGIRGVVGMITNDIMVWDSNMPV